jgi:hypothetical protein
MEEKMRGKKGEDVTSKKMEAGDQEEKKLKKMYKDGAGRLREKEVKIM